jgi:amino acid transporter
VSAELSSMYPSNAGYVVWVLAGLGPVAGFVNAWSSIFMNSLNLPLYTLVAANALRTRFGVGDAGCAALQGGMLLAGVAVNVVGVELVERLSGAMVGVVLSPFLLMPIVWAAGGRAFNWRALGTALPGWRGNAGLALSTVAWNSMGWNSLGNLAGGVRAPARNLPLGFAAAVVAITLNYVLPLAFALAMHPAVRGSDAGDDGAPAEWDEGYFVFIAGEAAGWLGVYAGVCCVLSCMANLIPQLTMGASALQATARAGMLPRAAAPLALNAGPWRTPVAAVLATTALAVAVLPLGYDALVQLQILFAMVGLVLQFAAFLKLRAAAPLAARPFAVPGGWRGAWALAAAFYALCFTLLVLEVANTTGWVEAIPLIGTLVFLPLATGAGVLWARTADVGAIIAALSVEADAAGNGNETAAAPTEKSALLPLKSRPGRERSSLGLVPVAADATDL